MNCPHCHQNFPENQPVSSCLFCGRDLRGESLATSGAPPTNWKIFYAVLFAPAIMSFVGLAANLGALLVIATFAGSAVAGIYCARMLDDRWGFSAPIKSLVTLGLCVLSFLLCFVGCAAAIPLMANR